jgi:hypothetical protein
MRMRPETSNANCIAANMPPKGGFAVCNEPPENNQHVVAGAEGAAQPAGANPETVLSEYFTTEQLAKDLRKSVRTLDRWALTGDGPARTRIGRMTLYRRDAVIAWLRSREQPARPPRKGGAR